MKTKVTTKYYYTMRHQYTAIKIFNRKRYKIPKIIPDMMTFELSCAVGTTTLGNCWVISKTESASGP